MEDLKHSEFDPSQCTCTEHLKNKLFAVDLSACAPKRLLCISCIRDTSYKEDIHNVLSKVTVDRMVDSIMQLHSEEMSNQTKRTLTAEIDKNFDELIEVIKIVRTKTKEQICKQPSQSLDSETSQKLEKLHSFMLETLDKYTKRPKSLKNGPRVESYVEGFNFLTQFNREAEDNQQLFIEKGLTLLESTKVRVSLLKKDILRWLESLVEEQATLSEEIEKKPIEVPVFTIQDEEDEPEEEEAVDLVKVEDERVHLPYEIIQQQSDRNPTEQTMKSNVGLPFGLEENAQGTMDQTPAFRQPTPITLSAEYTSFGDMKRPRNSAEGRERPHEILQKSNFGERNVSSAPTFGLNQQNTEDVGKEVEREVPRMLKFPQQMQENPPKHLDATLELSTPESMTKNSKPSATDYILVSNMIGGSPHAMGRNGGQNGNEKIQEIQPEYEEEEIRTMKVSPEEKKTPESVKRGSGYLKSFSPSPIRKIGKEIREIEVLASLFSEKGEQISEINDVEVNLKYRDIDDQGIREIATQIKALRHLPALALDFSSCSEITDAGVCFLCTEIANLPFLEALSLKFSSCYKITDKSLLQLAAVINKLKQLQTITICLNSCNTITDEGLIQLGFGVSRLISLESLTIDVSLCNSAQSSGLTDYGLTQFSVYLSQVQSLQHFTFYISSWNVTTHPMTDRGMSEFFLNISKLTQLQTLKLDFAWCINFSDKGLQSLSNLSKLKNLTSFKIDFSWCKSISNKGVSYLINGLSKLTLLTTLHLSFSYCHLIQDEAIMELAATLFPKLSKLLHLTLNFTWCSSLTDQGVVTLAHKLKYLPELISLSLHFNSSFLLGDESVYELANALGSLRNLQNLALYFIHCTKIGDIGHNTIANRLSQVPQLQRLSLSFSYCKQISEQSINLLSENLQKIQGLKNLSLDYTGCSKTAEQAIITLKQALAKKDEFKGIQSYTSEAGKTSNREGFRTWQGSKPGGRYDSPNA